MDKTKCSHADENGRIQNPTLNPCAEGISAVKAIAIAQSEGQKIYTINKQNAQTALQKLSIGGEVGSEIRNAVNAGKEVTVHEKSINKHGWKGFGYIVIDPETGAGAYLIEGSGNGAVAFLLGVGAGAVILTLLYDAAAAIMTGPIGIASIAITLAIIVPILTVYVASLASWLHSGSAADQTTKIKCFTGGLGYMLSAYGVFAAFGIGEIAGKLTGITLSILGISLDTLGGDTPLQCLFNKDPLEIGG